MALKPVDRIAWMGTVIAHAFRAAPGRPPGIAYCGVYPHRNDRPLSTPRCKQCARRVRQ